MDQILEKQIPLKFGRPVLPHLDRASQKSRIFANFDKYDQDPIKIQSKMAKEYKNPYYS